jgi:hypothetical protein
MRPRLHRRQEGGCVGRVLIAQVLELRNITDNGIAPRLSDFFRLVIHARDAKPATAVFARAALIFPAPMMTFHFGLIQESHGDGP